MSSALPAFGKGDSTDNKSLIRYRRSNADRAAETRASIIEATILALYDVGYSKTTFQVISARSGLSLGAIQYHYQTKEGIILATLDALLVDLQSSVDLLDRVTGTTQEKCRSFVEIMWRNHFSRDIYVAVWEIVIGCRAEPDMFQAAKINRENAMKMIYNAWLRMMEVDERHPSLPIVDLIMKFMRSSAFVNVGVSSEVYLPTQLELLIEILIKSFQD